MINGFYSSAAGMLGQLEQQDAISNNLANVNTAGFKRSRVSFSAFRSGLEAAAATRSADMAKKPGCVIPVPSVTQDRSQGIIEDTSNPTNFAIDGSGYFVVARGRAVELTRSGSFRLDSTGTLVTNEGKALLGQNGPVRISGTNWTVDPDGSVRVDGTVIDRLRIESGSAGQAANGRIAQGRLEGSNVSVVREMVSMLTALRAYEAGQRTIQALDQTLDKIINLPGRNG